MPLLTLELTPECILKADDANWNSDRKISEQTGLSIDAIRFYEKQRLLDRPPRTEGGFRLFCGKGVKSEIEGATVLLGSPKLRKTRM